ncbi:MAG: hypothetical protein M4579_005111 [Chaenotheca gracillima]|nr:MAG: hypothetical protein M4579_005111 [Chaenotheca gracillima]
MASSNNNQSTMNSHSVCYDPLDVDSLINYDQLRCPSPSLSSASSRSHSTARPGSETANPNNTLLPTQSAFYNSQQLFSGPSHQYDLHKQQTPLPMGAVANTLAVNEHTGITNRYQQPNLVAPSDDRFFGLSPADEFLDFNSVQDSQSSFGQGTDLDMDFQPTGNEDLPPFFFPERSMSSSSEYVNPNALGNQEQSIPEVMPSAQSQARDAVRPWPGMHQQQAALAKAKQQKMQQHQHQSQHQPQQQRPRTVSQPSRANPTSSVPQATDAIVNEKISRLLSSMRQSNAAGDPNDADSANMLPHIARMRKEEEDMDEDERLLASEEGKKLTSKERRQLRNKVSARAFRSRRKEYIGQLESDLNGKAGEINDLKLQNRALMLENSRLTDLSRMLLSSPAFSEVLESLSANGVPTTNSASSQPPAMTSAQGSNSRAPVRKDVNPFAANQRSSQGSDQDGPHIGMALIPDNAVDFSTLNLNNDNTWADSDMGAGSWTVPQHQVFSLHEVAQGPAVDRFDAGSLSGKSSDFVTSMFGVEAGKKDMPEIEPLPTLPEQFSEKPQHPEITPIPVDLDESDPAFDLFADSPSPAVTEPTCENSMTRPTSFSGKPSLYELVDQADSEHKDVASSDASRFARLYYSTEAALQRVEKMTSHL